MTKIIINLLNVQKKWEIGAWAYPGTSQFFSVPPIISGTGEATDFKFCRNIHRVDRNKKQWKMLGTVAVGVVRESRKLSGHPCMAHCAVIFAIAQLSCRSCNRPTVLFSDRNENSMPYRPHSAHFGAWAAAAAMFVDAAAATGCKCKAASTRWSYHLSTRWWIKQLNSLEMCSLGEFCSTIR